MPLRRLRRQPQLLGQGVGRDEAHALDVFGELVGIGADHVDGLRAVGLVDAGGQPDRDLVRLQEEHQVLDVLLLGPGADDDVQLLGGDARHLTQPLGSALDDVQRLLAEALHDALGRLGADALDQAGAKIATDALGRAGQLRLEGLYLDVAPVARVDLPLSAQ